MKFIIDKNKKIKYYTYNNQNISTTINIPMSFREYFKDTDKDFHLIFEDSKGKFFRHQMRIKKAEEMSRYLLPINFVKKILGNKKESNFLIHLEIYNNEDIRDRIY